MKTLQDFSPYNGLQWTVSKMQMTLSVQLKRALNATRRWI